MTRAPRLHRSWQHTRRGEGWPPWALGRAMELEAAFQIVVPDLKGESAGPWRSWLTNYNPRSLHGFIGWFLKRHPDRRVV